MKALLLMFATLFASQAHAGQCEVQVTNGSEIDVKVTVSLVFNNAYVPAGKSVTLPYRPEALATAPGYQLPLTVLNGRSSWLQGLWILGGAVIGQDAVSPEFFRQSGARAFRFERKGQSVSVNLEIHCG